MRKFKEQRPYPHIQSLRRAFWPVRLSLQSESLLAAAAKEVGMTATGHEEKPTAPRPSVG